MKFAYLTDALIQKNLTLREAGALCGRSATAVKAWCDGRGLADHRVQRRIAAITGDPAEVVEQRVLEYLEEEKCRTNPSQPERRLSEICAAFKAQLETATDEQGNLLSPELRMNLISLVDCMSKFPDEKGE